MASIFHSPRHWQCCKFGDELYVNLELCHKINGSQSFQQDIVKPLGWLADTLNNESPPHPLLLKPRPVQSYVFFFFFIRSTLWDYCTWICFAWFTRCNKIMQTTVNSACSCFISPPVGLRVIYHVCFFYDHWGRRLCGGVPPRD